MSYTSTTIDEIKFYSLPETVYQEQVQSGSIDENAFYLTTGNESGASYVNEEVLYLGNIAGSSGGSSTGSSVTTTSGTLLASEWDSTSKTQTIEVIGVLSTSPLLIGAHPDSLEEYGNSKIYATAQATNSITFTCETIPTSNLTVNIFIF